MQSALDTGIVDAHIHLWHYRLPAFDWLAGRPRLQRDFLAADLERSCEQAGVTCVVAVQAQRSLAETAWLERCARSSSLIGAVVGWVPLQSPQLPRLLDAMPRDSHVVGFRELLQDLPQGWLEDAAFNLGLRQLTQRGYTYDLLVRPHQLAAVVRLVARHPGQTFLLNHAAKPPVGHASLATWQAQLKLLARFPNVCCKLSGLMTECLPATASLDSLRPCLDTCVELFTPARLLVGSDWPVCLGAHATQTDWMNLVRQYLQPFPADERQAILSGNARRMYRLGAAVAHA